MKVTKDKSSMDRTVFTRIVFQWLRHIDNMLSIWCDDSGLMSSVSRSVIATNLLALSHGVKRFDYNHVVADAKLYLMVFGTERSILLSRLHDVCDTEEIQCIAKNTGSANDLSLWIDEASTFKSNMDAEPKKHEAIALIRLLDIYELIDIGVMSLTGSEPNPDIIKARMWCIENADVFSDALEYIRATIEAFHDFSDSSTHYLKPTLEKFQAVINASTN